MYRGATPIDLSTDVVSNALTHVIKAIIFCVMCDFKTTGLLALCCAWRLTPCRNDGSKVLVFLTADH